MRIAVGRRYSTAEADDDKICEEHALFKEKVDVCLKGTGFPLVTSRLLKVHCKHPSGIVSTSDQPESTS